MVNSLTMCEHVIKSFKVWSINLSDHKKPHSRRQLTKGKWPFHRDQMTLTGNIFNNVL